ncbi:MAG: type IV pilus assembly protein PilM [Candidatus Hydrogenedentota bacterium]
MAFSKSRAPNRLVLDIGTSAVRLCELSQTKAGFQLSKYYQREFNIDPAMDEADKQDRRAEVLGALLNEAKVRSRKAIVAVPGQSVFTRNRPLPPVPEYKVTQIVRYEIQQQIPFSLNEIALDYQVLDRTEVGGYDVMMAAIKVDVVEKQLEILSRVKRTVSIVDVSPLAAYNWLTHTGDFGEDGQCIALVDMGATTTDIVIQKDNQFKFTRSLHVGGNDVTSALASAFNMPFEEAERLKREKAFAPTGDANRDGRGGEVTGRVLGRLVGEINRSFAYFRSQPGGGPVTRVIITGGGSCLRNIIPYLQRQLNIEVRIAQPLAGLAIGPAANEASEHPEQACVALGLALRATQTVPIEINLIPPRVKEATKRKEQMVYWALTFFAILIIMASTIPATADKIDKTQERVKILKSILGKYDPALINNPQGRSSYQDEFNTVLNDVNSYRTEVVDLDTIRREQHFWVKQLHMINDARPQGIGISSFQTIVLGGKGNTGRKAYEIANPDKVIDTIEKPEAPKPQAQNEPTGGMSSFRVDVSKLKSSSGDILAFPGIAASTSILEPNAVAITGYAYDIPTVQEFERRLKETEGVIVNGVYLHVKDIEKVDLSELDSANFGSLESTAPKKKTGGGGSDKGIRISIDASTIARSSSSFNSAIASGIEVFRFDIEIQFMGEAIKFDQSQ